MKDHIDQIRGLVGKDALLIPCAFKSKQPIGTWKNKTAEDMSDPQHLAKLYKAGNVAVVLGKVSNGLVSIDFDDDSALTNFKRSNPAIWNTLMTKGKRGANLWYRMTGDFPSLFKMKGEGTGEFRSDGAYTLIHGQHPDGVDYKIINKAPIVSVCYEDIVLPDVSDTEYTELTEYTEYTEVTELTETNRSGRRGDEEEGLTDPESFVINYLPSKNGTNHDCLFKLARYCKTLEQKSGTSATMDELYDVLDCWHTRAVPYLRKRKSKEEYLDEFLTAYDCANHPDIDVLETAMERVHNQPLPPEASSRLITSPKCKQLVGLCYHLSEQSFTGVFFLSCRKAQELLGIPGYGTANKWLRLLERIGILKIHERGSPKTNKANRYTYVSSSY
jgi:hypothetical protein